ncbi:hypothetical protein RO3G_10459 [Rhizopus delemar RA 99-880]|uniref:Uncharacterized protein n=1 Tax=Rhizopus delemar (strain RA 99-880 / ATCC MYA-4621 / FGSC 9543 / NRRL 43880) TaxID=246409 RepID=I1CBB9_RHIO9|nr:hypothetical protein RO3G_10459 [Rhizopus delemar RA 99-880]|eukprot:EIE85749.1 hypothetical protein RO3G_10459 [Rhizopus delemar RA 99-880]
MFQPPQKELFTISDCCIFYRQRSVLISKVYRAVSSHSASYKSEARKPLSSAMRYPRSLALLNLTNRISLSDLDHAIRIRQADKAWTLFNTLSKRGDIIPLTICCSLYALLVFAKSALCRSTMVATRQRQMDQLLDYVQQYHQYTAELFLPSVRHIEIPLRKEIARLIRFEEPEKAWITFFRAHKEGKERLSRNLCIKLIILMLKSKTLTQDQLNHRVRTIALHGAAGIPKKKEKNRADALDELIGIILLNKDLSKAQYVLDTAREKYAEKITVNETVYIKLMNAYQKQQNSFQALKLFEQFLEGDHQPSLKGFNAILHILAFQKEPDRAVFVFSAMLKLNIKPDAATYTEMIRAYSRSTDQSKCIFFYNKMLQNQLTPNVYTYGALMDASAWRHDVQSVLRWFQIMLLNKIEPNEIIISLVLRSFSQQTNKNVPQVLHWIVQEASMAGIKPDAVLYTTLLKIQSERSGLESALKIHKEMIAHSIESNAYTYTTLIDACGDYNAPETAQEIFELMKKSNRHPPNTATYTALINAWARKSHLEQANTLILDFLKACKSDKTGRFWIDGRIHQRITWCTFC